MARVTPIAPEKIAECHRAKALRIALKIPRSDFAQMIGMGYHLLAAKEAGRIPFRTEEISRIRQA